MFITDNNNTNNNNNIAWKTVNNKVVSSFCCSRGKMTVASVETQVKKVYTKKTVRQTAAKQAKAREGGEIPVKALRKV